VVLEAKHFIFGRENRKDFIFDKSEKQGI